MSYYTTTSSSPTTSSGPTSGPTTSSGPITVLINGNFRTVTLIFIFVYLVGLFKVRSMKLEHLVNYKFFSKHCITSLIAIILGIIGFCIYIAFMVYCGQYKSLKDEETSTKGPELVNLINDTYIAFSFFIVLSIPLAGYGFYNWKTDI